MGVLEIATRLRELASQPENRRGIVHDQSMLSTIVVFLENGDASVTTIALETLNYLSQESDNHAAMRSEPNLQERVRDAMRDSASPRHRQLAQSVLDNMMNVSMDEWQDEQIDSDVDEEDDADEVVGSTRGPLGRTNQNDSTTSYAVLHERAGVRNARVSRPVRKLKQAREHTLFAPTLQDDAMRARIETQLLSTSGVLSFCIDMWARKISVRAHLPADDVIKAIEALGITVELGSKHATAVQGVPDYLDENEEPREAQSSGGWLGTLALWGTPANKKKKKSAGAGTGSGGGFLGSLTSGWW